ncbi:MAG: hypothetical protein ACRYG5_10010 [Janthinobacterium lividum]
MSDFWNNCMLDGYELDEAVNRLDAALPNRIVGLDRPSCLWQEGGPIIERDQIFLEAPTMKHFNYGDGKGEWRDFPLWRATVSARTRTYPNPNGPDFPDCIGRGEGPTPLIAAMRAFVASFGVSQPKVTG